METAGSLEKEYVLVEYDFEYTAKDGTVVSIKPNERYILLKRTNEHWWHVSLNNKSKPFYIPAKYVKVLPHIYQRTNDSQPVVNQPEKKRESLMAPQYSYAFLPPEDTLPEITIQHADTGSTLPASKVPQATSGSKLPATNVQQMSCSLPTASTQQVNTLPTARVSQTTSGTKLPATSEQQISSGTTLPTANTHQVNTLPTARGPQAIYGTKLTSTSVQQISTVNTLPTACVQQVNPSNKLPAVNEPKANASHTLPAFNISTAGSGEQKATVSNTLPVSSVPSLNANNTLPAGVLKRVGVGKSMPEAGAKRISFLSMSEDSVAFIPTAENTEKQDLMFSPLRTFHNSKKILNDKKRISFLSPMDNQPNLRSTQSLNDLEKIHLETPAQSAKIRESTASLTIVEDYKKECEAARPQTEAVKEEEEPVPVYVNIEEFRKESSRGRVNSQPHSSTSTFEEWETHTDKESGQLFYYNSLTGETTWDSPFDQSEEQTHSPISSPSPSLVLSESDWEKHFDEVTRQFYFYNSVTGDTSWDPPPDEDLNLPEMKPVLSSYRSMEKRPPTPEADYPEYPDDICNYPDTDYFDNHEHFEPVFPGNTSDDQTTGWYSQIGKEGKTFYKNNYSNETINYPPDPYRARSESDSDNKNVSNWHIASRQTESKGLVKAGVLHKTKIAENGKRIRKSWTSSWTVLEGDILTFYKDGKNLSSNSLKLSSSLTTPEHTVRLNGAKLEWASKEKSSKKNVVMLKTNDGSEYLIHHDSESIAASWFSTIKSSIGRNSTENVYEAETFPELESIEKLGIKDDKEKRLQAAQSTTSINSDSDRNVRAKLKKFLQRRPTLQSVRDKGYIKDQVFGCHLHQLCEGEKQNVPAFVTKAIAAVEKRGLDIDGLYRVSGNLATIQKLRYKVDHDENINLEDGRWQDVHVITGALKLFFRELPEPLFPYSHFDRFIETIKITDQNQRKYQIKELVMSLPAPNLETMRVLFKHLCSVIEHRESNRMSVQSIAIVFGPTLLRPETEGASIAMFMVFQSQIVEQILLQYKYIFNS